VGGSQPVPPAREDICKIYAESFRGEEHLKRIQEEAMAIVNAAYEEPKGNLCLRRLSRNMKKPTF